MNAQDRLEICLALVGKERLEDLNALERFAIKDFPITLSTPMPPHVQARLRDREAYAKWVERVEATVILQRIEAMGIFESPTGKYTSDYFTVKEVSFKHLYVEGAGFNMKRLRFTFSGDRAFEHDWKIGFYYDKRLDVSSDIAEAQVQALLDVAPSWVCKQMILPWLFSSAFVERA